MKLRDSFKYVGAFHFFPQYNVTILKYIVIHKRSFKVSTVHICTKESEAVFFDTYQLMHQYTDTIIKNICQAFVYRIYGFLSKNTVLFNASNIHYSIYSICSSSFSPLNFSFFI